MRADHLYYQLKTENENLLLQSSPRERIKRVKKFGQGDRKKKKRKKTEKNKMRSRAGVGARVHTLELILDLLSV